MLEAKGRVHLQLPCEQWVKEALATPRLTPTPLTPEIALDSTRLPGEFHGDPADRIIVATAGMKTRPATRDERVIRYGKQRHIMLC
jgi:PIN domain nuclease of toxin-antitoxin system